MTPSKKSKERVRVQTHKQKNSLRLQSCVRWLAVFLACGIAGTVGAATIYKKDNTTGLSSTASWVTASGGSTSPSAIGTSDVGTFDTTFATAANASGLTLGGNISMGSLVFGTLPADVTINYASGQALTLNSATAIVATSQNHNLTIDCPLTVTTAGNNFQATNSGAYTITFGPHCAITPPSSGAIVWRGGIGIFSGGGSYTGLTIDSTAGNTSAVKLGANNGFATTATVTVGNANGTGNLDLAGFNQSLAGITRGNANGGIGNSSTTSDSTLTTTGTSAYAGVIQDVMGSGTRKVALTVNGGQLTLSGTNTYSGTTSINAGTLILGANGSISNTPGISLAAGATLDVSAIASFNLSGNTTLSAAGSTGSPASINGGTTVNLGSRPITLAYGGLSPALIISHGTLSLNGNAFTVNKASPLAAGSYNIVSANSSISSAGSYSVAGTAIGTGTYGVVSVSGTNVVLTIGSNTLNLASSAQTNGYLSPVSFTIAIQTNGVTAGNATGYVLFETNNVVISSNGISGGSANSAAISNLPRGTNIITAVYSGDSNYMPSMATLNQVVTNHVPVANANSYGRNGLLTWKIPVGNVLTNVTDTDNDTLTLISVGISTNGITLSNITNAPGFVAYYNTNHVDDEFSYTVSDGFGGTSTGIITLTYNNHGGMTGTNSIASITGSNPKILLAYGIPNYRYITERSTDLVSWADIATNVAAANGMITVTDGFSDLGGNAPPTAYYRMKWSGD